jgi:hypothetical protein
MALFLPAVMGLLLLVLPIYALVAALIVLFLVLDAIIWTDPQREQTLWATLWRAMLGAAYISATYAFALASSHDAHTVLWFWIAAGLVASAILLFLGIYLLKYRREPEGDLP